MLYFDLEMYTYNFSNTDKVDAYIENIVNGQTIT